MQIRRAIAPLPSRSSSQDTRSLARSTPHPYGPSPRFELFSVNDFPREGIVLWRDVFRGSFQARHHADGMLVESVKKSSTPDTCA